MEASIPKNTTAEEKMAMQGVGVTRGSMRKQNGNRQPTVPATFGKNPFAFRTGGSLIMTNNIARLKKSMVVI
jgi:hypothetical protein